MNRRDFLKITGAGALTISAASCRNAAGFFADSSNARKPNIIFILGDDLGQSEPGCYGNDFNETPNIDKLAADGIRFTDSYSAAPVCSPTRAALMTGQYPARTGITDYLRPNDSKHLAAESKTIAQMLKRAGYRTGIIGKWHLSGYASAGAEEFGPSMFGFDEVIISENRGIGGGSYFYPYHFNPEIKNRLGEKEYLIDRCNLEAVEFIERNTDNPFFLYLSHFAVHTALKGKDELVAKYEKKPNAGKGPKARINNPHLAAQMESIDEGVGIIVKKLESLNLTDNTIIIFTGDNGGERNVTENRPYRDGKSSLYEGGLRVPLIIKWPGVVKGGSICSMPASTIDFYPTFAEALGIIPDKTQIIDGVSILPVLKNPQASLNRDNLYWHYPLAAPHFLGGRSSGAVRQGNWKLIKFYDKDEFELYNIAEDIGEKNNLAGLEGKKADELQNLLAKWCKDVSADFPEGQPKKTVITGSN